MRGEGTRAAPGDRDGTGGVLSGMGKREKVRAKKVKAKVEARRGPARSPAGRAGKSGSPGIASRTRAAGARAATAGGGGGTSGGVVGGKVVSYDPGLKILVVGDGDFSFSAGLVRHRKGKGAGLTLTSFDSAAEVGQKYKTAKANLAAVNAAGATVLHGVDATRLDRSFPVAAGDGHRFDRIVFNFPHSGQQRVHVNRELLHNFFLSAQGHLTPAGQAHVTLKMRPPYSEWQVEAQAKKAGMRTVDVLHFDQKVFPGYRHVTTEADAKTFVAAAQREARLCKTFCFVVRGSGRRGGDEDQAEDQEGEGAEDEYEEAETEGMDVDVEEEVDAGAEQLIGELLRGGAAEVVREGGSDDESGVGARDEGVAHGGAEDAAGDAVDQGFWTSDVLAELHAELAGASKMPGGGASKARAGAGAATS